MRCDGQCIGSIPWHAHPPDFVTALKGVSVERKLNGIESNSLRDFQSRGEVERITQLSVDGRFVAAFSGRRRRGCFLRRILLSEFREEADRLSWLGWIRSRQLHQQYADLAHVLDQLDRDSVLGDARK